MVFFLGVELASGEPRPAAGPEGTVHWSELARQTGALAEAYRQARAERVADLAMFGRPIETTASAATDPADLADLAPFDAPDPATQADREAWRQRLLDRMFYLYREELDDRMGGESETQYAAFLREIS